MSRLEVARVVAVGRRDAEVCSVVAVRLEGGSVELYPHGLSKLRVWLPAEEWRKLVELEVA
jgi:hypothetical protein